MKYISMLNKFTIWVGLLFIGMGIAVIAKDKLITVWGIADSQLLTTIIPIVMGWAVGSAVLPTYKFIMEYNQS